MANKKINELDSRSSLSLSDLMAVGDPSTGYLYKTTISDLKTLTGAGVVSFNGRFGSVVPAEGDYSLTQLSDVIITSASNNQVLQFNGSNWVNATIDLSGYVPYTGATGNVNLGSNTLLAAQIKATSSAGLSINANSGTQIADLGAGGGANMTLFGGLTGTSASFSSSVTGNTIVKTGGTSSQFLKADGSVDSSTYLTTSSAASTYVPLTRTITINGQTFDLSADRTYTVAIHDAVTIGTANGLSLSGQVLSLALASTSATGALSSTDWNTFNGKQAAGNYVTIDTTQTISGAKTFSAIPVIDNGSSGMGLRFKMYASSSFGLNGYMDIAPINNQGIVGFAFGISSTVTKLAYFSAAGLTDNTARTFTLPDASGTLALTSNLSSYVPYSGATGAVNLGAFDLTVNSVRVGRGAGSDNSTNTAVGASSLNANTIGTHNTGVGYNSLLVNTSGGDNTAFGYNTLKSNTTASANTAIGGHSLETNITGNLNTALGYLSLQFATNNNNTAIGSQSGIDITTGSNNLCVGYQSGWGITTGSNNTIIGTITGLSGSLSNNIILADGAGNIRYQWNGTNNVFTNPLSATSAVFSSTVQASAYRLTGMTGGSGALYWTSDRVTVANYNASGILTFEVNGGATALILASTGAATFSNSLQSTSLNVIAGASSSFSFAVDQQSSIPFGSTNGKRIGVIRDSTADDNGLQFGYDLTDKTGIIAGAATTVGCGIDFYTFNGSTWANRMRVTKDGNVGLGTNSPSHLLDVNGTTRINGSLLTNTIRTNEGSISVGSGSYGTIFTLSGSKAVFQVFTQVPAGAGDAANYTAFATVLFDGIAARIIANNGGVTDIILSGLNVQARQQSGNPQTIEWKYLRIQ
jgi:hypothetical protein